MTFRRVPTIKSISLFAASSAAFPNEFCLSIQLFPFRCWQVACSKRDLPIIHYDMSAGHDVAIFMLWHNDQVGMGNPEPMNDQTNTLGLEMLS
jgi:hypothetical protein